MFVITKIDRTVIATTKYIKVFGYALYVSSPSVSELKCCYACILKQFNAHSQLGTRISIAFQYTSCLAGNKLVTSLAKNTAYAKAGQIFWSAVRLKKIWSLRATLLKNKELKL